MSPRDVPRCASPTTVSGHTAFRRPAGRKRGALARPQRLALSPRQRQVVMFAVILNLFAREREFNDLDCCSKPGQ